MIASFCTPLAYKDDNALESLPGEQQAEPKHTDNELDRVEVFMPSLNIWTPHFYRTFFLPASGPLPHRAFGPLSIRAFGPLSIRTFGPLFVWTFGPLPQIMWTSLPQIIWTPVLWFFYPSPSDRKDPCSSEFFDPSPSDLLDPSPELLDPSPTTSLDPSPSEPSIIPSSVSLNPDLPNLQPPVMPTHRSEYTVPARSSVSPMPWCTSHNACCTSSNTCLCSEPQSD